MVTVGMFHRRKDPSKLRKTYAYAAVARLEGIDFFYFTPGSVDFETAKMLGQFYEQGEWVTREVPFPDVVINACSPLTRKHREIYYKLKEIIPFTSRPVGNKLSVFNRIKRGRRFSEYLIPYEKVSHPLTILNFLEKYNRLIIKPIAGAHGDDIVFIEQTEAGYCCLENAETIRLAKMDLLEFLAKKIGSGKKLLVQPYINCRTRSGQPYDFRLHLQRGKTGAWEITCIYPKVGVVEGIVSNVGKGGQISLLDKFLAHEFGEDYLNIRRYLEVFALQFVEHFQSLYAEPLDEIGIDVGLDENRKLWIYEVNWRPGAMFFELDVARKTILYAAYLGETVKS